jgi:hypothetical protein
MMLPLSCLLATALFLLCFVSFTWYKSWIFWNNHSLVYYSPAFFYVLFASLGTSTSLESFEQDIDDFSINNFMHYSIYICYWTSSDIIYSLSSWKLHSTIHCKYQCGIFSSIAIDIAGKFRDVTKLMLTIGMPSCSTAWALHFLPVPM